MEFDFEEITRAISQEIEKELNLKTKEFEEDMIKKVQANNGDNTKYINEYVKFVHDSAVKASVSMAIGTLQVYHIKLMEYLSEKGVK